MSVQPRIYRSESQIHHRGVYAAQDIPKGKKIVRYRGKLVPRTIGLRSESEYLYELNRKFYVLGQNIARYINHSCDPNCESDIIRGEIWIQSIRKIRKGEELTYNYGFDLNESLEYPCFCGAKQCAGFIIDDTLRPKLRRHLKKQKRKKKTKQ